MVLYWHGWIGWLILWSFLGEEKRGLTRHLNWQRDLIRNSSGCSSASRSASCRVVMKKNTDLWKTYVRILLAIHFVSSTRLLKLGRLINYRLEQNMCRVCSSRFYQRSRHSQKWCMTNFDCEKKSSRWPGWHMQSAIFMCTSRLFDALVGRACHLQHADAPNEFPLNQIKAFFDQGNSSISRERWTLWTSNSCRQSLVLTTLPSIHFASPKIAMYNVYTTSATAFL